MGREKNNSSSELRKAEVGEAGALPPTGLQLLITQPCTKAVGTKPRPGGTAARPLCTQHGTKGVNCEVMNVSIN